MKFIEVVLRFKSFVFWEVKDFQERNIVKNTKLVLFCHKFIDLYKIHSKNNIFMIKFDVCLLSYFVEIGFMEGKWG